MGRTYGRQTAWLGSERVRLDVGAVMNKGVTYVRVERYTRGCLARPFGRVGSRLVPLRSLSKRRVTS